jgi:DNA repair exonuclease SbcCD ATPase subunit
MLTGRNGSGKSTVFDAVTFALFGHHRGGSQQVQELINKESNALAVEFEFALDDTLYRIRRTAKRSSRGSPASTQQISQNDGDRWTAVPDTSKKAAFDQWIRDKIGLQFETFTSSVLLLQGKAEKLLDASPKGRAELLACIVDLERFQRLHELADAKRKAAKSELDANQLQSENLPEVTDEQWQDAVDQLDNAAKQHTAAKAAVEAALKREFDSQRWEELQKRIGRLSEQLRQANALLGDAVAVEADFERFKELRDVLPHVSAVQQMISEIDKSRDRTRHHQANCQAIRMRRDERDHIHHLAREKRTALQKQQAVDEQRRQAAEIELRNLSAVLERVRLLEEEQTRLIESENRLQSLPTEPRRLAHEANDRVEHCVESARVLPILERFASSRESLPELEKKLAAARKQEQERRQQGEEAKLNEQRARAESEKTASAREAADARTTEANTLLHQARTLLAECADLQGQANCRLCGQSLTAEHLRDEKYRREQAVADAEKTQREALHHQSLAKAATIESQEQLRQAEQSLAKLRDAYRDVKVEIDQAQRDNERCTRECREAYDALPARQRVQIASEVPDRWTATAYPEAAVVAALRDEVAMLDVLRRQHREAEDVARQWEGLESKVDHAKQNIARLRRELPAGEPAAVRAEHQQLQAEATALNNALAAARTALTANQAEIDRLQVELGEIDKQAAELETQISGEEAYRRTSLESVERSCRALPETWRALARDAGLADQHRWTLELHDLEEKDAAQRYERLVQARLGLENLRTELAETEKAAASIPEEARLPPSEAREHLASARKAESVITEQVRDADRAKNELERRRAERAQLDADHRRLDYVLNQYKLLTELLGRGRLQRHLVRKAERQIVDLANGVLDRLSGGQLRMRLCSGDDGDSPDRALELEAYNRITGEQPINIAFLSGSQRFRVAVSLALGIGQYASKQHRPIESVIIDEGFGCLDREGRHVMIQELQNLRGQLRCILLVSHQEEFAEAFPDGYRFELVNGSTRVSRFQR